MPKYSYDFKKKVVTEYMNGEGGFLYYIIPRVRKKERICDCRD